MGASGSTIAGNQASGTAGLQGEGNPGGISGTGGRGGGIWVAHPFSMTHTILGDNAALVSGPDCQNAIDSEDYNLIESVLDCTIVNPGHDIVGEDPDLVALAENGGETDTHALQPGSPALDGGSAVCTDHSPTGKPGLSLRIAQPR